MTEVSNQQQRGGLAVPTLLTAGGAVGGYFAADKANFGYKPEVKSWEEAVAKVNAQDKVDFVTKRIDKAEGAEKEAWKALQANVNKVQEADKAIIEMVQEGADDYSDELSKYLKALDAKKNVAKDATDDVIKNLDDAVKEAKTALKDKVKLKDGISFEDDFMRAITKRKNLFADKGDDVAQQLKHIKFANKWINAGIFAAAGLLAGLGINALCKNKE